MMFRSITHSDLGLLSVPDRASRRLGREDAAVHHDEKPARSARAFPSQSRQEEQTYKSSYELSESRRDTPVWLYTPRVAAGGLVTPCARRGEMDKDYQSLRSTTQDTLYLSLVCAG